MLGLLDQGGLHHQLGVVEGPFWLEASSGLLGLPHAVDAVAETEVSLHSVALAESAMDADAQRLAGAVLLCAEVSHLKAVMAVRREIIDAGFTPSAQIPGPGDLASAESELMLHQL